ALRLAEHRVVPAERVLVGPAPGMVDAHRVVGRDRPVEEAPVRPVRVLGAQPLERPLLTPAGEEVVLLGDEIWLRGDASEHQASSAGRRWRNLYRDLPSGWGARNGRPGILPAMHAPEGP